MKRKYLILFSLSGLVLCCDQLTKLWVSAKYPLGFRSTWISGFLTLVHTENVGFVFGLLQGASPSIKQVFIVGLPTFALVLIVMIFIKLQDDQMLTSVALTTILGGAVGNLIDRLQRGYVVDFLEFRIGDLFTATPMNIADISILTGVVLMFLNTLLQGQGLREAK